MTERRGDQALAGDGPQEAPTGTGAVAAVTLASTAAGRTPTIRAEVRDDGTGELAVDGVVQQVRAGSLAEAGAAVTARIAELAAAAGRSLPAEIRDPDGLWALLIHPDGTVDEAPGTGDETGTADTGPAASAPAATGASRSGAVASPTRAGATGTPATPAASTPGPAAPAPDASPTASPTAAPAASPAASPAAPPAALAASEPTPAVPAPTTGATRAVAAPVSRAQTRTGAVAVVREPQPASGSLTLPTLDDLLATRHSATGGPAEEGWRGTVRRLTGGRWAPHPGPAERRRRGEVAAVRRSLDGPRTIVVLNPKGGAHKTTATMLLAATFGLQRGGYTLAWDNNETRGTLGWRSSHADHTRTAVDLLHALPSLTARGTVRIGDLDQFVRTQPTEQFDVLASDEDAASAALFDARSFSELHSILSRFYRVLVVDTGNNMRASNWQAAIDVADQLVIVSTIREDTAQSAAWAIDALRATGHDEAVRRAVTVLSAPDAKVDKELRNRLRSHFGALTRDVVDVPHDPALVAGGPIRFDELSTRTRDAWLHVTSVVAEGL
ncbi:chromosome partitioning protein [Cellulomonas soli]|uniref:Chromosome partitioning protein n=1 Tax=Cellulomonas soli TaxID=931535 RepID=A0A512PF73_9CELL|nr:chromosome partitioning protein [Cellulomonas soli]NYI59363.1 MinD-like ATPase involved in chromosome partitioning or flagellar assembly [Cellulomonas soli]GEP69849.1 hypothetical protein CSO01_25640 [Cellulomonas soli]